MGGVYIRIKKKHRPLLEDIALVSQLGLTMAGSILFCFAIGYFLLPKIKWWITFENPDRALAYFAFFIAFVILFQQITGFKYGIIYVLSDSAARHLIDQSYTQSSVIGVWNYIIYVVYWLFIVCALLS